MHEASGKSGNLWTRPRKGSIFFCPKLPRSPCSIAESNIIDASIFALANERSEAERNAMRKGSDRHAASLFASVDASECALGWRSAQGEQRLDSMFRFGVGLLEHKPSFLRDSLSAAWLLPAKRHRQPARDALCRAVPRAWLGLTVPQPAAVPGCASASCARLGLSKLCLAVRIGLERI